MQSNETTDLLLMSLLQYPAADYRHLYFELGSEWQLLHARGWKLWGDKVWECWWHTEWSRFTELYLERVKVSENGQPYMLIPAHRVCGLVVSRMTMCEMYAQFMIDQLIKCEANRAVMELSLHNAIKINNKK